jgi:peptide/nickel transport system substrate-binding protein
MTKFFLSGEGPRGIRRRDVLAGGAALVAAGMLAPFGALAQETPRTGGRLRIALGADIQPAFMLAGRGGNNVFRHNVFDTLTVIDSETGRPRPILATEWESSEDGLTFTIRIREDARFHTGRPLTAADVVFTLEQMKVPENASQMRALAEEYTSIEATGDYEVTITSTKPVAPRVFDLFQLAVILDQETAAGLADGSQVIGSGPFKFDQWVPGASARLVRNDEYWGGAPYLDEIEYAIIADSTAMANALRGRVDLVVSMTPRDAVLFRGDPNIEVFQNPGGQIVPLGIDVTAAPFDNKELRQAIGFAIDRQRIIDQVYSGAGVPHCLWWRSSEPGTTEELATHYNYDPDKARELIAAAGAEGIDVPMQVIGFGAIPAVYEIVQNNLREVGLNPTGGVVETAVFDRGQAEGELGPVFMQAHGLQGFSAATLVDALPALRPNNPSKMDEPRYRELKDALQSAQDDDAYADALQELATYMLDEAFSHILVQAPPLSARRTTVEDLVFDNVGYLHLGKAWISG